MRIGLIVVVLLGLFAAAFPVDAQGDGGCLDAPTPRLISGERGRVGPGAANNVRSQSDADADLVGTIPAGSEFTVLDGPVCAGGFNWWQVDYEGLVGWTVEGQGDDYWLEPLPAETGPTPSTSLASYTAAELNSFELIATLGCPQEKTRTADGIDINAEGHLVAFGCGSSDNAFGVYDLSTNTLLDVYGDHPGFVRRLHFVPGSNRVLAVTDDVLALWDLDTTTKLAEQDIFFVRGVAFKPDGSQFATANQSGSGVTLWDAATLTPLETLADDRLPIVDNLTFSPDGRLLAGVGRGHTVRVWDMEGGAGWFATQAETESAIYTTIRGIAFSPDGQHLLTSACLEEDRECVRLQVDRWDVASGTSTAAWVYNAPDVTALAFLPGGRYVMMAHYFEITVLDTETGERLPSSIKEGASQFALSPDGVYLVLSGGTPRIYRNAARAPESATDAYTPPPDSAAAALACEGALPSRLVAGAAGRLRDGINLNIRAGTDTEYERLGQIPGGGMFTVIAGPKCAGGYAWWQVAYEDLQGWIIESSNGEYWTEPISANELAAARSGALTRHNIAAIEPQATLGRGMPSGVHWSPDGSTVAVASSTGLWLYDAADLSQPARYIRGQFGHSTHAVFSPDGTHIATPECLDIDSTFNCPDPAVTVWDVQTGEVVQRLRSDGNVSGVAFSPDGTTLAFSSGTVVRFLDIATGSVSHYLPFAGDVRLLGMAESKLNGFTVIAIETGSGYDQHVELRVADSGTEQFRGLPVGAFSYFAPNLSGALYVPFSSDVSDILRLDNNPNTRFNIPHDNISGPDSPAAAAFTPGGNLLLIGTRGGNLRLWDTVNMVEVQRFDNVSTGTIRHVALNPDGTQAMISARRAPTEQGLSVEIFAIDLESGDLLAQSSGYMPPVTGLAFDADQVIAISNGPVLTAWDTTTLQQVPAANTMLNTDHELFDAAGHFIADEETVMVLDPATGETLQTLKRFDAGNITSMAVYEGRLAVGYETGAVSLFDLETGEMTGQLPPFPGTHISALAFNPDGSLLAYSNTEGQFRVLDPASGAVLSEGTIGDSAIEDIAFTLDSTALAIGLGGYSGEVGLLLWDITKSSQLARLQAQTGKITRVVFSPDGMMLATGNQDGTIVLWRLPAELN